MKGLLAFFTLSLVLRAQPYGSIIVKQFNNGNSITIHQDAKVAFYNAPRNFLGPLFISNHRRDALRKPEGQVSAPKTKPDYLKDVQALSLIHI